MSERTLSEVLDRQRESIFAGLRVMLPARVERFDKAKQQCDATPLVKQPRIVEGQTVVEAMPVITNVPVVFPGSGGLRITFPVHLGDVVMLVWADLSLDVWLAQGGFVDPRDFRTHNISDAVAIPGLLPFSAAWGGAEDGVITLGNESGESQFVATAQRVLEQLQAIANAFNSHTHTVATAGAPTTHTGTAAPPSSPMAGLQAPASATVKVRG